MTYCLLPSHHVMLHTFLILHTLLQITYDYKHKPSNCTLPANNNQEYNKGFARYKAAGSTYRSLKHQTE
jgi:hypothetical protein